MMRGPYTKAEYAQDLDDARSLIEQENFDEAAEIVNNLLDVEVGEMLLTQREREVLAQRATYLKVIIEERQCFTSTAFAPENGRKRRRRAR